MYVYVYVYVYAYAYAYVYRYGYLHIFMCVCIYVHVYAHVYMYVCMTKLMVTPYRNYLSYVHACCCVHICLEEVQRACLGVFIHVVMRIYFLIRATRMLRYLRTYTFTYHLIRTSNSMHINHYIYIYIYIYICTKTHYIYIYIYINKLTRNSHTYRDFGTHNRELSPKVSLVRPLPWTLISVST